MKWCLLHYEGNVIAEARAEGGGMLGDFVETIKPGDTFLGHSFADIKALGEGEHDIEEKAEA